MGRYRETESTLHTGARKRSYTHRLVSQHHLSWLDVSHSHQQVPPAIIVSYCEGKAGTRGPGTTPGLYEVKNGGKDREFTITIVKTQRNSTELKETLNQLALELDTVERCSPPPPPQTFQPLID